MDTRDEITEQLKKVAEKIANETGHFIRSVEFNYRPIATMHGDKYEVDQVKLFTQKSF